MEWRKMLALKGDLDEAIQSAGDDDQQAARSALAAIEELSVLDRDYKERRSALVIKVRSSSRQTSKIIDGPLRLALARFFYWLCMDVTVADVGFGLAGGRRIDGGRVRTLIGPIEYEAACATCGNGVSLQLFTRTDIPPLSRIECTDCQEIRRRRATEYRDGL